MKNFVIFLFLISIFSFKQALSDDVSDAKQNIISQFTNSVTSALENIIDGEGDEEVSISGGQDLHPEFSIMAVRPLSVHPEVDVWFVQLQLNNTKIRGKGRYSINTGIGYRKLSPDKNYFTGANVFFDYDERDNMRSSIGLELRSSAFEAFANYYYALSGGINNNDFTERTLDGYDLGVVGEVPYLPWANIVINHYNWEAEKNSSNSEGERYSLEMTLTPNLIVEAGGDDNSIDGYNRFVKAYLVFPARDGAAASTNLIGESAFSKGDISSQLLSKVRRTNKIIVESQGTGVVIARQ